MIEEGGHFDTSMIAARWKDTQMRGPNALIHTSQTWARVRNWIYFSSLMFMQII